MTIYGYFRCSTNLQDEERQIRALKDAKVDFINGDKMGSKYVKLNKHFFPNLIYPNSWLSILYFALRKISYIFKKQ